MTVNEARKLLNDEIRDMTDDEVMQMIAADSELIDVIFTIYGKHIALYGTIRDKGEQYGYQ